MTELWAQLIFAVCGKWYQKFKIYNNGSLVVPDDVTIMRTDDNYGYMRQNANNTERARACRTGVYYHILYYGYPTNYYHMSSEAVKYKTP